MRQHGKSIGERGRCGAVGLIVNYGNLKMGERLGMN